MPRSEALVVGKFGFQQGILSKLITFDKKKGDEGDKKAGLEGDRPSFWQLIEIRCSEVFLKHQLNLTYSIYEIGCFTAVGTEK